MNQPIQIISDLHLCASRPELTSLFRHYMENIAPQSNQLFVLGDLFELWIGDDCLLEAPPQSKFYLDILSIFKSYSKNHGELFFIHGNRDFLLAEKFEALSGGKLLQEPYLFKIQNKNIAFIHGDSLCTDDVAYQEFRKMVRNPQWQAQFLALPISKRIEIASDIRQQSQDAQKKKSNEIMDVNQDSVNAFISKHQLDWLIHGHTHRQATHKFMIDEKQVRRIVLSDWGEQGFYLSMVDTSISEHYFDVPNS